MCQGIGIVVENSDEAIIDAVLECAKNAHKIVQMREVLRANEYGNKEYIKEIEARLFE